jgi:hypothetical protein
MPSPIGASGGFSTGAMQIIGPVPMVQKVQAESEIAAGKLAEQIAAQSAATPKDGRGRIVDTFA